MLRVLLFAAGFTTAAPASANDPLPTALFRLCPGLLSGSIKSDDSKALAALGFKLTQGGARPVIAAIDRADVQIDPSMLNRHVCPVTIPNVSQASVEGLSQVLKEKGLTVKTLSSPIGGTLINGEDRSGKPVTTTQVMKDSIVTLVVGAVHE